MDQAALDLIKRAARASTNYAFMAGGAFILITLISKIVDPAGTVVAAVRSKRAIDTNE